jgi:GTPase SAR1 family protein
MLVYDVTDRRTFTAVREWIDQIERVWLLFCIKFTTAHSACKCTQHAVPNVSKILIGNKIDLEKERVSILLCSLFSRD